MRKLRLDRVPTFPPSWKMLFGKTFVFINRLQKQEASGLPLLLLHFPEETDIKGQIRCQMFQWGNDTNGPLLKNIFCPHLPVATALLSAACVHHWVPNYISILPPLFFIQTTAETSLAPFVLLYPPKATIWLLFNHKHRRTFSTKICGNAQLYSS